jgi:hypothetical protein
VESGSIGKLVKVFVEIATGVAVPLRSIAVCGSFSHLADFGIAAYSSDFVETSRIFFYISGRK